MVIHAEMGVSSDIAIPQGIDRADGFGYRGMPSDVVDHGDDVRYADDKVNLIPVSILQHPPGAEVNGEKSLLAGKAEGEEGHYLPSPETFPSDPNLKAQNIWETGNKRFTEFLGKRMRVSHPKAILAKILLPSPAEQMPTTKGENVLAVLEDGANSHEGVIRPRSVGDNPISLRKEMLKRFLTKVYISMMTPKANPKRQYEFVGKRYAGIVPILAVANSGDDDDQDKRYEFLGKRSYGFLGKRSYGFLGKKRSYGFLGKRSYGFLGKRDYDFLGKRSYDFLGKRSYDFLGKRNYDFLGKRNYDFLGKRRNEGFNNGENGGETKRSYDFLGKRKFDDGNDDNDNSDIPDAGDELKEVMAYNADHNIPSNIDTNSKPPAKPSSKRYSEWLGKRKRSPMKVSTHERIALLLRNNNLRKRLSRFLISSRINSQRGPEFIGK